MLDITEQNEIDIKIIKESGLFDYDFYYTNYRDVKISGVDAVIHYVLYGNQEGRLPNPYFDQVEYEAIFGEQIGSSENSFAHYIKKGGDDSFFNRGFLEDYSYALVRRGLRRFGNFPLFNADEYLRMNSDVDRKRVSPDRHAFLYGVSEGREVFSKRAIFSYLGYACKKGIAKPEVQAVARLKFPKNIGVFFHSDGNSFIKELADDLAEALRSAGLDATVTNEKLSIDRKPDLCVFCAPHEFFFLPGSEDWRSDSIVSTSIMYNTEQMQTPWFCRGVPFLFMSKAVIDICYQNVSAFIQAGIPCFHYDPIAKPNGEFCHAEDEEHALFRALPKEAKSRPDITKPFKERSIDICFFANESSKRDRFLAKTAGFLSDYECFLYYRRFPGPISASKRDGILSRLPNNVACHSKIMLNIHRDDSQFFEWHRIVKQGMCCGTVVVSEHCFPHPLFKENEHFLVEEPRHMPNLLEWLIKSSDGHGNAARIQRNAFALIRNKKINTQKYNEIKTFVGRVWGEQK